MCTDDRVYRAGKAQSVTDTLLQLKCSLHRHGNTIGMKKKVEKSSNDDVQLFLIRGGVGQLPWQQAHTNVAEHLCAA